MTTFRSSYHTEAPYNKKPNPKPKSKKQLTKTLLSSSTLLSEETSSTSMSLTSSLSFSSKTHFLNGTAPLSLFSKPNSTPRKPSFSCLPPIRAMKTMQGRVVCATNDKTVSVEVVRLDTHPKYKRRVRKKKKYQAHDPENIFQVGDVVQLQRSRPISKTKAFIAVAVPPRKTNKKPDSAADNELGIPLESELQQQT